MFPWRHTANRVPRDRDVFGQHLVIFKKASVRPPVTKMRGILGTRLIHAGFRKKQVDIWLLPTIITMSSKRKTRELKKSSSWGIHCLQSSLLSPGWFFIIGFIVNVSRLFALSFVRVVNRTVFLCRVHTPQKQSSSVLQLSYSHFVHGRCFLGCTIRWFFLPVEKAKLKQ